LKATGHLSSDSASVLDRLTRLHPKAIDLSLGRIERLLSRLGRPQDRLPPVIHIAGTNGKGSVLAFLRAILSAGGARVHTYTSPHLVRFHERITLAGDDDRRGAPIGEAELENVLRECESANAGAPITFFEITTAAAFLALSRRPADVALIEVGLGGRFDATNVLPRTALTVITPVSLDHQEFLGAELGAIAREKAGILKPDVVGVVGPQDREALVAIENEAHRLGAPLVVHGQDFRGFEERGRFVYEDGRALLDLTPPKLRGRHQIDNASVAVAAARIFSRDSVSLEAVDWGLQNVEWPARLQRLTRDRLAALASHSDGADVWLDGGHNPGAGRALAQSMADLQDHVYRPLYLVVGMLGKKDAYGFLSSFATLARGVVAVPVPGQNNAHSPQSICAAAARAGLPCETAGDVPAALKRILDREAGGAPSPASPRILICGSLYLAGHVLGLTGRP